MGWQDAPVVDSTSSDQPAWMKAPVIGKKLSDVPSVPGTSDEGTIFAPNVAAPKKSTGMLDKVLGVGDAALTAGTGMIAQPIGNIVGVMDQIARGKLGNVEGGKEAERLAGRISNRFTWQPQTETGRDILGGVGKAVDASGIAGLGPMGAEFAAIPRPPPALGMAGRAGMEMAGKAGRAIAESPEGQLIGKGVSKVGAAMRPNIDPQVAELARKAEGMGIKITPDMLMDNRIGKFVGQGSRDVPYSGSIRESNFEAFNKLIARSYGSKKLPGKIDPKDFNDALTEHGEAIGNLSERYPINATELKNKIDPYLYEIRNEVPEVRGVINGYLNDLNEATIKGPSVSLIDGTAFKNLRSELTGQMRRLGKDQGGLKRAMNKLDNVMLDAIRENLSPQELPEFDQARIYYSNAKMLEPMIGKAVSKGKGNFSPAALSQAVTSSASQKSAIARGRGGDLSDISAVANRFMTEPPSSGTAERNLVYGIGGIGTGAVNPWIPAGIWSGANLYNRLGPRIARKMIPPPPP